MNHFKFLNAIEKEENRKKKTPKWNENYIRKWHNHQPNKLSRESRLLSRLSAASRCKMRSDVAASVAYEI